MSTPMGAISTLSALAEAIKHLQGPIAVVAHLKPDGDAIGSVVGLCELLRARGVDVIGMTPDPVPPYLRHLTNGLDYWREPSLDHLKDRTLVTLDTSQRVLLANVGENDRPVALTIDHHATFVPYSAAYFVDASSSSTAQLVAELAQILGGISPHGATALYTGMLTDTNRFQWIGDNTNLGRAMTAAAWLTTQGAQAAEANERLMGSVRRPYLKLLSMALDRAEFFFEGRVLLLALTEEDYQSISALDEDREQLKNTLSMIEGVQVSALVNFKNGMCKASVRARHDRYAVHKLCALFKGGGHARAAGMGQGINEPLESFLPRFREALLLHWKTYGEVSG